MKPALLLSAALATAALAGAPSERASKVQAFEAYRKVVADTCSMTRDNEARTLAGKHGLEILDVTWEDTGRFEDSAVGPNISDMTIQVHQLDPRTEAATLSCMPVIRYPNFIDKSADLSPEKFFLLVGNEKGSELTKVSLKELLGDLRRYLHDGKSWKGERTSLLAPRDTHVLVSAQACFLPIPKEGEATFNPVLFNYQSVKGDPAVLTILATREGTSVTVIDNQRDGFAGGGGMWGQRLFFDKAGERAAFTGKRMSDFVRQGGTGWTGAAGFRSPEAAGQEGLNLVLLIQVPLKQKNPPRTGMVMEDSLDADASNMPAPAAAGAKSDVEAAVIGHGKVEGPFTEIDDLDIERDDRFPVRVTVQFYKATSNGAVSAEDLGEIAGQIEKVYGQADYVGSLVVDGRRGRPTEHDGPRVEPTDWWPVFWAHQKKGLGIDQDEAVRILEKRLGPHWTRHTQWECLTVLQDQR